MTKELNLGSAEAALLSKLKTGSKIDILFLDPRSDLVDRLAKEEGQNPEDMLSNIAKSIGVCKRLYALLNEETIGDTRARLRIQIYDEVPSFAYHKVSDKVTVGLYFARALGITSPAFEVFDDEIKRLFEEHFRSISLSAIIRKLTLLSFEEGQSIKFAQDLYDDIYEILVARLGKTKVYEFIGGIWKEEEIG